MASDKLSPRPGDLIEIFHCGYQHWAIYVGDGYVVHLCLLSGFLGSNSIDLVSPFSDKAVVRKDLLVHVARRNKYRINNKHDDKYPTLLPSKIVSQAEQLVGHVIPYSLTSKNCEHFVNKLRYGVKRCDQVKEAATIVGVTAGVMGAVAVTADIIGKLLSRKDKEKQ